MNNTHQSMFVDMSSPSGWNINHTMNADISLNRNDVYSMAETIDQNLTSLNERLQRKINELNECTQSSSFDSQHP